MTRVNEQGYLEARFKGKKKPHSKGSWVHVFLIKASSRISYSNGKKYVSLAAQPLNITAIYLPKELIGKKVRFKLEVLK